MELFSGALATDDRGKVMFVNDFDFAGVKRFYAVENHHKGFIRAWHGHEKEGKYVFVSRGVAVIGAVPLDGDEPERYVLSANNPQVLWIPSGYANGSMSLTNDCQIIYFSTATIEESMGDDIRFPAYKWNIWKVEPR